MTTSRHRLRRDLLGLLTKEQPPEPSHVLQGVSFQLSFQGVTVAPTARRVNHLTEHIQRALATEALTPEEAHRLAGRLAFLTQAMFGSVGRAALSPMYARSNDTAASEDARLSTGLRAALRALLALLANVEPRFIPFYPTEVVKAVLYADAFFKEGELRHKAGHVDASARALAQDRWNNGWGFVLRVGTIDC